MIVYRLTKSDFKEDISGSGAKINGSRWNSKGMPMLFTAEHISLATLEMLVHINFVEIPNSLYLLNISLPETSTISEIKINSLKTSWRNDEDYTSFIGDQFLLQNNVLFLKVPSAVIKEESNFIINPIHKDFSNVKIIKSELFEFDKRFFSPHE